MRHWILLAIILSSGLAAAHTVTMNYAVRIADGNNTLRVNDRSYFYNGSFPAENDMVLYMHLDNSTLDGGLYGNHGTIVNGADCSENTSGQINSACRFDGIDDYIQVNDAVNINFTATQSFTVMAWINTTSLPSGLTQMDIVSKRNGKGWRFQINDSIYLSALMNDGVDTPRYNSTVNVSFNAWNHVVMVIDRISQAVNFYINGIDVTGSNNISIIGDLTRETPIFIGRGPGALAYFNGTIDEIIIWNRSLTAAEVAGLYAVQAQKFAALNSMTKKYILLNKTNTLASIISAGQFSSAGLNVNYTKDITNSSNLIALHLDNSTRDSSLQSNNGTINGNVVCALNTAGKINTGCSFSGGYINFSKLNIEGAKNYTIAAWTKTSASGTQNIFTQSDGTTNHLISVLLSGGVAAFNTFEGGAGNVADSATINDGDWHHVAAVKSGTIGRVYVDGVLRATGAVASPSSTNETWIGAGVGGASAFSGNIDEFLAYNDALSDADVYDLYQHDPHHVLAQMSQNSDNSRFLLAVTNGTYNDIENKLQMIDSTGIVSTTFGHFVTSLPSMFPIFIRLEYKDVDIGNRLEWSGIGKLVIKNAGFTSRGIPSVTLELIR